MTRLPAVRLLLLLLLLLLPAAAAAAAAAAARYCGELCKESLLFLLAVELTRFSGLCCLKGLLRARRNRKLMILLPAHAATFF